MENMKTCREKKRKSLESLSLSLSRISNEKLQRRVEETTDFVMENEQAAKALLLLIILLLSIVHRNVDTSVVPGSTCKHHKRINKEASSQKTKLTVKRRTGGRLFCGV